MQLKLKPWKENENLYFYPQSQQLSGQTGLIGILRADFGSDGNSFYSTWEDQRTDLKTEEFKDEFDKVINSFRFRNSAPLSSRKALNKFLQTADQALLPGDSNWSGFRTDTENNSYLFRLKGDPGDYNLYCYCYKRESLNYHMLE